MPPCLRACIFWLLLPGCVRNAGTGGTGEIVVPQERTQSINAFDPAAASLPVPPPSSQPVTQPATAPSRVELSIERVREMALRNNLDLRVELLNPTISKQALTEAEARFEAVFVTDATYAATDEATASRLENAQAQSLNLAPGIQLPLITGGTASITAPFSRLETNNAFSTLNPAYTSNLQGAFTIPVLRGAGVYYNTQQIRVAFYEYQATLATTKLEVTRVLADAERAYWALFAAKQELLVRQKQYDLAVTQLERARREVKAQILADVEVTRADSGVSDTVEQVITAENAVALHQRDLKRIMNDPLVGVQSATEILPSTPPNANEYRLDPDKLVASAMRDRMELLATELHIAEETSNVRVARNDLLPLVTLNYQYSQNGLGSTPGGAYDLLERNRFADHIVGVHLEVPIGNDAAKSRLRASLARRLQQLATKEQQQTQIKEDVLNALDTFNLNWQRILAARKRVQLNARLVEAEIRQFELGLRTSTEVLDAQSKLADAQSSEVAALTDYQVAQVDIAYATGNVLGEARVVWQPIVGPAK